MYYCVPWAQSKKRKKNCKQNKAKKEEKEHKESNQTSKLLPLKILQKGVEIAEVDLSTLRMNFMDLCSATNHFNVNNAIGVGMSGIMYKANLPNGWSLAVKRLYNSEFFQRQFNLEKSILVRPHRNIVPLLGFCVEKEERILVYQFMPNGKLSDWLGEAVGLEWPVRARIALGLVRSLSWLHHGLSFVHLSVSSECILLDQNFEPKLSNFGEAKFMNQNTNDEQGFMKKDVYDFGIVLFELITGEIFSQKSDFFNNSESTFATHTTNLLQSPFALSDTIDKCLIGNGFEGEIFSLLTIACDCVQSLPEERPTMPEIYNRMSNLWERHGQSEDSEMPKKSAIASVGTRVDEIVELE
ncbi:hypothetical protein L6164_032710 [Bauhinia variegata]|uniref:Uncharacterized protein n=1 Tax=Bauhinia variegata TaxID=167791 RepID=A0ACB9KPI4_BAUVA|nr:hypothetical protein L6164_032710 [Bauhinia variegata]